jgi:hypothetical protein
MADEFISRELQRLKDQRRVIESVSRIGPEEIPLDRLMHHVAAQVSRITHIDKRKQNKE